MKTRVFFRADGNKKIGLGHVIRSLALAEMLKDTFECHFLIQNPLRTLKQQILTTCQDVFDLPESVNYPEEATLIIDSIVRPDDIIVLDGYHFDTSYQKYFKAKGIRVVCIDDIPQHHFVADAIINHVGGIDEKAYSAEPETDFFLGPTYALLRKPFIEASIKRDFSKWENAIFLCLGGADPCNNTLDILQKLESEERIEKVYLITGAAYSHHEVLDKYLETSALTVHKLENLTAKEMVAVMQCCPLAICPPSTIAYEYLSVGGTLYLYQIADNQTLIKSFLLENKIAFDFAQFPVTNNNSILENIRNQEKIFNGENRNNILNIFKKIKDADFMPASERRLRG